MGGVIGLFILAVLSLNPSTVILVEAMFGATSSQEKVILQSPRVTSYGLWGSWEDCPKGSYVRAMQLKVQRDVGKGGDNTAMNAVKLCCSFPGYSNCVKWIKSSEGPYGDWGVIEYCGGSETAPKATGRAKTSTAAKGIISARGFVLRQDEFQRKSKGVKYDNTASNNMQLICQDDSIIEGDGLDGGYWDWEEPKECPENQLICGVRTQIVPPQGGADDAGLNNIDLKCCER